MDTKKVKKWVDVPYTAEELNEIGLKLARKHEERAALETRKKLANDEFKADATLIEGQIQGLASSRIRGVHTEEMDCEVSYDWAAGTKSYVNPLTGELFGAEPVTDKERQIALSATESAIAKEEVTV